MTFAIVMAMAAAGLTVGMLLLVHNKHLVLAMVCAGVAILCSGLGSRQLQKTTAAKPYEQCCEEKNYP